MTGIGTIMFGKAVILSVWAGIASAWASFRKQRAQRGIPLKQNKDGVYVANDWAAKVEFTIRFVGRALFVVGMIWMTIAVATVTYVRLTGDHRATDYVIKVVFG